MTWAGRKNNRSGQAIIFFIMVLVILVFVVLWNYEEIEPANSGRISRTAQEFFNRHADSLNSRRGVTIFAYPLLFVGPKNCHE